MPTYTGMKLRVARALHRPSSVPLAAPVPEARPAGGSPPYSPSLRFDDCYAAATRAIRDHAERVRGGVFLDIGGSTGSSASAFTGPFTYRSLDLVPHDGDEFLLGDITNCPAVEDDSIEVAYAHRMMEFVAEPWLAAAEIGRILRPGGIVIIVACFAWRYHPGLPDGSQPDFWRYTHDGLEFIFEKYGHLERVQSGYDLRHRRRDDRGGKISGGLDVPPVDELGGFRETWTVWYIGRKPSRPRDA